MSTPGSEETMNNLADRAAQPLARLASAEVVVKAREGLTRLVSKYPASTVVGAFALGFAIARLFRSLASED
jgi:hypothetical protein